MVLRNLGVVGLGLGLGWAGSGCFAGEGTLGSICREDADCGANQVCTNEVCGRCGDGIAQPGELCFSEAVTLDAAPEGALAELLALDVDGDGRIDLLTRGADGLPAQWNGDGQGGWALAAKATDVGTEGALGVADLDGDGALDLVVADDDAFALHLGYGSAELGWTFQGAVGLPEARAVLDLAVAGATEGTRAWVAWVDDRGLVQATVEPGQGALGMAQRLADDRTLRIGEPATIDGDPSLDLPVVDLEAMQLEIWWGDGTGGLGAGEPLALSARPVDVVVADVDGDGDVDLLVPDEDGGITVLVGDGEGQLVQTQRAAVPGAARTVVVADLNRDNERDLLVLVDDADPVWVLLGRGFRHRDALALPVGGPVGALAAVDGDRDGLLELVLGPRSEPGALRVLEVEP